jgi:protein arginine kinase activator
MRCEHCGEQDAEIHLTEIVEDEMATIHLCSSCAAEKGVASSTPPAPPIADFLAHLGESGQETSLSGATEPCPYCGTTARDFRKTGRLGCPQCYAHFAPQIRGLLRRIHGASQHMGKVYLTAACDLDDQNLRLATLRRRLERAVEIEDFEAAATLRDQILEMSGVE